MTPPLADVGPRSLPARRTARCWENTAPYVPHGEPQRPSAGRDPRRLAFALLGAFALAALCRARARRRPTPVIHRLVAADEMRFTALCQQITDARRGVEQ
ncbi:hypothetical protein [Streptomyces lydicus]|uniref:hypothetical protein n=1 Tax=Streptomyces lydicus TaxID=47763 RepID=UPI000F8F0F74|nr:hypothetical protein [Streptomyces lydicus]